MTTKVKIVTQDEVGLALKKPCADCPFLTATPKHKGIAGSLVEYSGFMNQGTFAHTCHKTDVRADSIEGKRYKGKVQHCAGALALMKNDPETMSNWIMGKVIKKQFSFKNIDETGVYKSFKAMALDYYKWCKAGMPNELTDQLKLKGQYEANDS